MVARPLRRSQSHRHPRSGTPHPIQTEEDSSYDWGLFCEVFPSKPKELFRRPDGQVCGFRCYGVSADGQRFLMRDRTMARETVTRMDLVLNWTGTLTKKN